MSLLDLLTGGKNKDAEDALRQAQAAFGSIQTPTQEQLTLPELQKYVQAGLMTPAEAQAVLQGKNAYEDINTDSRPVEAEMSALSKMQDIADAGGLDDQAKAALAEAKNQSQITTQGQRGSIIDQMAARGIPTSLMSEAMQAAAAGQDAQTESLVGAKAAGDAEQRALQALSESGTLGGQIHGQQYNEAANKAAAANAIQQWNAGTQTNTNVSNAANKQAANAYNAGTAQDVANKNTTTSNERTAYNTNVPQQVFNNAITKATGQSGVAAKQADQATQAGQQEAGLYGGLLGAAGQVGASYLAPTPMVAAEGGAVPGKAPVAGDSPHNDRVPAMLSPGEVVVPRSVAGNPEMAKQFVAHVMRNKVPIKPAHPDDVRSILEALTSRRAA